MLAGPRGAPRVGEQHEREQPRDLGVVRQQAVKDPRQSDRLVREIGPVQIGPRAAGVALVEDQVEHVQHRAEPLGALLLGGQREGDARGLDALLGAADPLRHRRLGHEERARDLGGGEAADRAQRERDRRRRRERGMAAHEEQHERVVVVDGDLAVGRRDEGPVGPELARDGLLAAPPRDLAAHAIGHAPEGDLDEPPARIVGHALARPLHRRRDQRLLHRVFGGGEVAVAADDRAEHLRRELAQQVSDGGVDGFRRHYSTAGTAHHLRAPRSAC